MPGLGFVHSGRWGITQAIRSTKMYDNSFFQLKILRGCHFIRFMELRRNAKLAMVTGLTMVAIAARPARACTIFVLTDTSHALFCNNEDWSDSNTRMWFQPAGEGYYGAVYVGFVNGWPQGGLNTEGLAFDWVMGGKEKWDLKPSSPSARGNSSQRMLETCNTVKDAITFYRTHAEPVFSYSKVLVADKTGASVIIGAKDGQLQIEESNQCRGFGFGGRGKLAAALARRAALANQPEPTVAEGFQILHDSRQAGQYATRYSNVFDLKSGDIFLRTYPERDDVVRLNLAAELQQGSPLLRDAPDQRTTGASPQATAAKPEALSFGRVQTDSGQGARAHRSYARHGSGCRPRHPACPRLRH